MKPFYSDTLVTLSHGDALDGLRSLPDESVHALVTDPPSGIAFMSLEWDGNRGGRDQWIAWLAEIMRECWRVLKPGAHGLVWALPRTSHWTALALEDAGFEVRDCIQHWFGNGFPKALDIGQAIDRELGAEREVVGKHPKPGSTCPRLAMGDGWQSSPDLTAPAIPEALPWEGWKSALKPASEFWWLVRKPLSERNLARNILAHGTGGLNIEACRVGQQVVNPRQSPLGHNGGVWESDGRASVCHPVGRYPPHTLLSHSPDCTDDACAPDCPVAELGRQSGVRSTNGYRKGGNLKFTTRRNYAQDEYTQAMRRSDYVGIADTGTAARYFPVFRYEAKPPPSERRGSFHPTQKSLALMKWLITLVSTEGQTILDPFAGSGTTLVAARELNRRAIGVEQEQAYCQIIEGRLAQGVLPLFDEEEEST